MRIGNEEKRKNFEIQIYYYINTFYICECVCIYTNMYICIWYKNIFPSSLWLSCMAQLQYRGIIVT